jgi:outer membrane protein assembly factor BamB
LRAEPFRRIQAAHLAYGDGILVCPTNVGMLVGVDLLTGNLAWAIPYGESQSACDEWKATSPIISDGKIVYAPPDAGSLYCLDLRDGSLVWSRKKDKEDLYVGGVVAGIVVIVGKGRVEGVRLANGESLWKLPTGMPSGQGAAAGNVFYLPLRESIHSKEPEVCAIDLAKGRIVAHQKTRNKEVPGNLLFFQGQMLSVTPWEIVAYPDLQSKINQSNARLSDSPNDPAGLTERALLRRDNGDLSGSIGDLRNALKNNPDRDTRHRARSLLFEVLGESFRRDIRDADKHLKEYEELCAVDRAGTEGEALKARVEEERRRREDYFLLVARLRTTQGRLKDALNAYADFLALGSADELLGQAGEPARKVRRDVWVRARTADLFRKATPAQRKELEEELGRRLKDAQGRDDVRSLRDLAALCGDAAAVGHEARLRLAEALMGQRNYLESEVECERVRRRSEDPAQVARALEMLGRIMLARNLLPDAAYYYRLLRRDFGTTMLPDGRTGADVWDALSADKRLLPYLEESDPFAEGRIKARAEPCSLPMTEKVFQFEQQGEKLPFFRRHLVGVQLVRDAFEVTDRATGEERWRAHLTPLWGPLLTQQANESDPTASNEARFWYHTLGHLVILPVADRIIALDPVGRRVLWEKNLLIADEGKKGAGSATYMLARKELRTAAGKRSLEIAYPDGFVQTLAENVVLSPSALCLVTRASLQVVEPLTGRLLWMLSDLPPRSRIFAADDTLFVVSQDADGKAVSTRALRLMDGDTVPVPDFTVLLGKQRQRVGRRLLLTEGAEKGAIALRLYDILTGADVWKQTYPDDSIVLDSQDPNFTGVVEPDGTVHVVDLRSPRRGLTGKLLDPKKDLLRVYTIHLLADDRYFYLASQTWYDSSYWKTDPSAAESNWRTDMGVRVLPVNGILYAFERTTGDVAWYWTVKNQMLLLNQFAELPVVFLTSRHAVRDRQTESTAKDVPVLSIEKRSGKALFDEKNLPKASPFYAVRLDPVTGTLDFVSPTVKVTHRRVDGK